jgi:hypothetical protein
METVSEIQKRKRGRPRRFSEIEMKLARWQADARTERHHQNIAYQTRAVAELTKDKRFAWLCDEPAMTRGDAHSWKPTILMELGRVADPADMKAIAGHLCEQKPKTHDAVAMIRQYRLGKPKKGNALDLAIAIERTVNDYLRFHRDTPLTVVHEALLFVADEVREKNAASGPTDGDGII